MEASAVGELARRAALVGRSLMVMMMVTLMVVMLMMMVTVMVVMMMMMVTVMVVMMIKRSGKSKSRGMTINKKLMDDNAKENEEETC